MEYLDLMKMIIPDVAGEFMVMGATLMYIKSRMLLPQDQQISDPEAPADELDPRWDLIRQLVEYKKFKEAAEHLHTKEVLQESLYTRQQSTLGFELPSEENTVLGEVSIFDLLNAFNKVLKRADQAENLQEIFEDRYTVSDKIDFILKLTAMEERTTFARLFEGMASRTEIIVTFLAILELIRLKQLRVAQAESFGEIDIVRVKEDPATSAISETGASQQVSTTTEPNP
jgi:segregation and condensation protein A